MGVKSFPLFSAEKNIDPSPISALNARIAEFNKTLEQDAQRGEEVREFFRRLRKGYVDRKREDVIERFNFVINHISLPNLFPKMWDLDFDHDEGILIVEIKLPDVVHHQVFKMVTLKSGKVRKPITTKERKEIVPNFHPAVMLRIAYEIFRNDEARVLRLLIVNGWVEFDDPSTGNKTQT